MSALDKVKLGFSPLSGEMYLYRHGVDPNKALEKREIAPELVPVFIQHMMHECPKGAIQEFNVDDKFYRIGILPIPGFTEDEE